MLGPTHVRGGVQTGLILAIFLVILNVNLTIFNNNIQNIFIGIMLCMGGAIFGCEWPDIDHPMSRPRREHPIWGIGFQFFHIKHRGKFSHSYLSTFLFWGAVTVASSVLIDQYKDYEYTSLILKIFIIFAIANQLKIIIGAIDSIISSDVMKFTGVMPLLMFIMTDDKTYAQEAHYRLPNSKKKVMFQVLAFAISILISLMISSKNEDLSKFISLYFISVLFGTWNHLTFDMSTWDGVWLGWTKQIKPIQFLLHIPFMKLMIPDGGKTNSRWENRFRVFVSITDIILFVTLILVLIKYA